MGKVQNTTVSDALYAEFLAAISDLTKSMAIAVARMELRAKFNAAIANAEKAERAAGEFYFATACSTEMAEQGQISRVAQTATTGQQDSSSRDAHTNKTDALDELHVACGWVDAACTWLETALVPHAEPEGEIHSAESLIAMRIVELQHRLGGFIKH
jgi:hypothetical protein